MQTRPDMRGNLNPPTFDLLCLFCFRSSHTGHEFLTDETVLDPHYDSRTGTIYLKSPPQTDLFGTHGWRGRGAWLWTRGRAGGHTDATRGGGRAREDIP